MWHDQGLSHGPSIADSSQERLRRSEYFCRLDLQLLSGANDTWLHGRSWGKEFLFTEATTKQLKQLGPCQVRSKTEHPCPHQAVVEIHGIPFCERCAREQEVYFAIGELETRAQGMAELELAGRIAEAGK